MLEDFTGGGQIFLHKIRMFFQVLNRSFSVACLCSLILVGLVSYIPAKSLDAKATITYQKAIFANGMEESMRWFRAIVNPKSKNYSNRIDAYTDNGYIERDVDVRKIIRSHIFKREYLKSMDWIYNRFLMFLGCMSGVLLLIYIYWSRYGSEVTEQKHLTGASIKTAKEVTNYLHSHKMLSHFKIGEMNLVKDSETRHILVTGSTGSGKTNLIHNLLPQIIKLKQPALIVDQTGEMIARYYDEGRGDIIFNPLDERTHSWDFFADTAPSSQGDVHSSIEKFAKILFSYGKRRTSGDPFWDNSANAVFCSIVEYLHRNSQSIDELKKMCGDYRVQTLSKILQGTKASRYLESASVTTSSILSVLSSNTKPLNLLFESSKKFSLTKYFKNANNGSPAFLFLSSCPNAREVTAPLIAGLFELSIANLMKLGVNHDRRFCFVMDELASLGRLNGFSTLMSEARKYGGCVLAATQSFNQLFENFGTYGANHLFSQFGTKFIFRSDDEISSKMLSNIAGELEYTQQQKNTSFGANEFRDGISYTEQQKHKKLITTDQLASLATHECFVTLPEPKVRIAKIKVPLASSSFKKCQGFIEKSNATTIINSAQNTEILASNEQPQHSNYTYVKEEELDNDYEPVHAAKMMS
jgi:type IV conjugative transfer system coupling protein TraD